MRLLITSSRMPFALDAIRKLGERGHEVYASDSYEDSPGSHSRFLGGHFVTASPFGDPEAFAADVERIAAENEVELILPMFGEVFYLAAQHKRISAVTRLSRQSRSSARSSPGTDSCRWTSSIPTTA